MHGPLCCANDDDDDNNNNDNKNRFPLQSKESGGFEESIDGHKRFQFPFDGSGTQSSSSPCREESRLHIPAHIQPIAPVPVPVPLPLGAAAHIQRAAPAVQRNNSSFIRVGSLCFHAIRVQRWTRAWSAAEELRSFGRGPVTPSPSPAAGETPSSRSSRRRRRSSGGSSDWRTQMP